MPFCIWPIFKQAYLAASRCCPDDQIRARQERSRSECGMRSGGFPGAELAGCSQPQGTALTLSAALVMFSPSCKCLSHPWGVFLPCTVPSPDVGWAGWTCLGASFWRSHGVVPAWGRAEALTPLGPRRSRSNSLLLCLLILHSQPCAHVRAFCSLAAAREEQAVAAPAVAAAGQSQLSCSATSGCFMGKLTYHI